MAAATQGYRNAIDDPLPSGSSVLSKSTAKCDSGLKKVRFVTSEKRSMSHVNGMCTSQAMCSSSSDKKTATSLPNKPQSDQTDKQGEEEVYEVEAILSHRKRARSKELEFLLKWKGYTESENSWEPKSNLSCNELLHQYMVKHKLVSNSNHVKSEKSSIEQSERTGQNKVKQRRPKKSEACSNDIGKAKLPRNKPAALNLSNTSGEAGTKKVKHKVSKKSSEKPALPKNHLKELQAAVGGKSVMKPKHNIRTHAQVTPVNSSTSLAREEDQHLNVAAPGVKKPTVSGRKNVQGDKADDDDVVLLYVDPPRNHRPVTQLKNPFLLSPTDVYFSAISQLQLARTYTPTSLPASPDFSLKEELVHTDSDSSATLTVTSDTSVTLSTNSQCSSPLVGSPYSDKSFNLQLSPSSSTEESESPDKLPAHEVCHGTPPTRSPTTSFIGLSNGLHVLPSSTKSRSRAKQHTSRHKKKTVLKKRSKQRLNQSIQSSISFKRMDLPSRRGRMGPVPRPCQPVHHQSVLTSLQTKAAKDSDSSSTSPHVNGTNTVKTHSIDTNHATKDDHISVIFKFKGMCKQVLVRKHNLFTSSDTSDTDSGIATEEPVLSAKRHKTMNAHTCSTDSDTAVSYCNSVNGVRPKQLLTGILSNKKFSPSHSNGESLKQGSNNGLNLVHVDSSTSTSGSFTNSLHFRPLQAWSPNGVSSESIYCDSMSNVASVESVKYKQVLLDWQFQLNRQRGGTDDIIFVENEIDMIDPPKSFTYICSNIYGEGVPDPNLPQVRDSLCGCQCYHLGKKCGPKAPYCCSTMADVPFAYTLAGKVCVTPGTPIYECNWKCSCPVDCVNRVVQHGRKIPLCIFRTGNSRGWGVKTLQPIKANTFVTEYVGEVITSEEAERRGKHYDEEGETYLFDLDFDDDHMFTIDAKNYGNISHFFNHSCDPNLVVYSVWIDTLDKRLPRIAFFTTKNVPAGEELTFDYQMNLDQGRNMSRRKITCRCGSQNCLQYIN